MSRTYEKKEAAEHYNAARAMPDESMALWMGKLKEIVPARGIGNILDLGGGTGRFTGALQRTYNCPVTVVDPSEEMLKQGSARGLADANWVRADAEKLPFADSSFSLVWMSQVFHHLEDKPRAFKEVLRVLSPDGFLVIRNGTIETDLEIKWMDLIPEVRKTGNNNIPYRDDIIKTAEKSGFVLTHKEVVYQKFASSYREYYEKLSKRGLSLLLSISDEAFNRGMKKVKEWTDVQPERQPVYEPVEWFVFRKRTG